MDHSIQRALVKGNIDRLRGDLSHVPYIADFLFDLRFVLVARLHEIDHDGRKVEAKLVCIASC
jgi:hypothetical protein